MEERLPAEELDQEFGDAGRLFVLKPVARVREGIELCIGAVAQTIVCHFGNEKRIALAPKDSRGNANGAIGELGAMAK